MTGIGVLTRTTMSFSFRNLFAQDKSVEANDLAGAGPAPGSAANPTAPAGEKPNPFSSAPFSNVFSRAEAIEPPLSPQQSKAPAFQPTPMATNRGSFEALFAGQGIDPKAQPAPGTMKARYLVRDILPFLPPALVSPDKLPMDRAIEVSVPDSGGGEVKLSAIQAACPELFATEITPLNDSVVTLPQSGMGMGAAPAQGFPSAARPTLSPPREGVFAGSGSQAPTGSMNPFAAAPGPSVVAAATAAASARNVQAAAVGNPFSASPNETVPSAPSASAAGLPFGFPDTPPAAQSPFGAFGTPLIPAQTTPIMAEAPKPGPFSAPMPGFAPTNVSLFGGDPAPRPDRSLETGIAQPVASAPPPPPAEPASGTDFPWQTKLDPFGGSTGNHPIPGFEAPTQKPVATPAPLVPATPVETNPFGPPNLFGAVPGEPNPFGGAATPAPASEPVAEKKSEPAPGGGSIFDQPADTGKSAPGLGGFDFSKLWGPPQETPAAKPATEAPTKASADFGADWPDFSAAGSGGASFFDQGHDAAFAGEPFDFSSPWQSSANPQKPAAPAPKAEESENSVVFSLGEILRPIAKVAGIHLASIPPVAKVRLPISLIEPQLSRGAVSVTIGQLVAHCDAGATGVLGEVNRDLTVPLPQNELFHQLSELAPELVPSSYEDLESQFSTLFGTEAMHDAANWDESPFGRPQKETTKLEAFAPEPAPEKATKKAPVDLGGLTGTKPAAPSPAFSDPFAPLPRRKNAPESLTPKKPDGQAQPEDIDTSFFDDLNEFSTAVSAPPSAFEQELELEPKEAEVEQPVAAKPEKSKSSKSDTAFPIDTEKNWAAAEKASLDDLEQSSAPVAKPASKAPKISISVQRTPEPSKEAPAPKVEKPVPIKVVATAAKPEPTGFFDELNAADVPAGVPDAPTPKSQLPPATAPAPVQSSGTNGLRDIELRAVFGTNEPFTYLRVADLTASLPGITAAAIVAPGFTAQSPRNREAGELAIQASSLILGVREIARLSGMPNAETFTLHTDQGVVSIFLHEDYCLTVRHQTGQFDPGVREKLILVARGLAGLSA